MQHLQYFWKRIFLKIIFGITVKCVAILLIFIVTDEKLILYQYIIITKNYVQEAQDTEWSYYWNYFKFLITSIDKQQSFQITAYKWLNLFQYSNSKSSDDQISLW